MQDSQPSAACPASNPMLDFATMSGPRALESTCEDGQG
jgi:hypothetical protein